MKKLVKLSVALFGMLALTFGASSCKKDDPEECCTIVYDGETYKYCENDDYVKEILDEYDWSWDDFKALITLADGDCN